ncbi:MAG TPA: hypothetical protein VMW82_01380 [Candidatus Paceibacterota bacterium]|nr:hypothetical protein [Candidatus Paceibacterota bacterium]
MKLFKKGDVKISVISTLIGIVLGGLISYSVSSYFYQKDIASIRRKLSFPVTPAEFLKIGSVIPTLGRLIEPLDAHKYVYDDIDKVDYKWMKRLYKKDGNGDWIWRLCPRCGGENIRKVSGSCRHGRCFGWIYINDMKEDSSYNIVFPLLDKYRLRCDDCDTVEEYFTAEVHAEAISRFFLDLDKIKKILEGEEKQEFYLTFDNAISDVVMGKTLKVLKGKEFEMRKKLNEKQ